MDWLWQTAAVPALLVTEGIKCLAAQFGHSIRGRRAVLLFVVVLLATQLDFYGDWVRANLRDAALMCFLVRGLAAVGVYSFVTRLFAALARAGRGR